MPSSGTSNPTMAAGAGGGRITRLPEIWEALEMHCPRDKWVPLDDIYALVEASVRLKPGDFDRAAPQSHQTKWQRNVRNVLQHRKTAMKTKPAQILWDAPTCSYLIPSREDVLPPALLATPEEEYVPEGPHSFEPDATEELLAESLMDAREREWRAIVVRRGGREFRNALLDAYGGRCAITTTSGPPALEAAHIVPYRGPQTNHPANGLLLRGDVHTLFDLGLVAVNPFTMRIETARELLDSDYRALASRPLVMPSDAEAQPSQRSLLYHYQLSRVVA